MRLAKMVNLYLAATGIDQKQAAIDIGISESTFSRFIAGRGMPDAEGFMKIIVWVTGKECR